MARVSFTLDDSTATPRATPDTVILEPGDRLTFDGGQDAAGKARPVVLIPNDNVVSVHADITFPQSAIKVKKVPGSPGPPPTPDSFQVSFTDPGGGDEDTGSH